MRVSIFFIFYYLLFYPGNWDYFSGLTSVVIRMGLYYYFLEIAFLRLCGIVEKFEIHGENQSYATRKIYIFSLSQENSPFYCKMNHFMFI